MEQWEYLHVGFATTEVEEATRRYGMEGWELASLVVIRYRQDITSMLVHAYEADRFAAVFKRRIASFEKI
ncbi:hypothetical protein [Dictyobacter aurantiacus]|uniref:DUF4177 domain-containing protein n=1 Tax=Dictyobacter aurantiacus TaxID=1936993 RepID=A0A401ZJN2_9CHLR|nr:hypothetical protein [Dictyobacter aurantiacus]GCE07066.1 hypothetical protein KDAU_43950 [Dictyobacter aurantiacus]